MPNFTSKPANQTIRKKQEFKQFIRVLKNGGVKNWTILANALGVSNDTITSWRKHPEAIKAHAEGVQEALNNMESSGKNDWRMWREKLKLLGISDTSNMSVVGLINTNNKVYVHLPKRLDESDV